MAQQAKELEDRLERLSGSMPPGPTDDPEITRVKATATTAPDFVDSAVPVARGKPLVVDFAPKRKRTALVLIGAAFLVFVLAGVGIAVYLYFQVPEGTKPDLVAINGGNFLMGRQDGSPVETPPHPVTVQPFMMDRTEVSNTEYAEFVSDTNHPPPSHWAGKKPPFGQEMWPVVNVSFEDANAFAAWRSKRDGVTYRLPTEQEWEYAARNGDRNDLYPWGSEWQNNVAVLKEATPSPIGSRQAGKNRWGVVDLIGNVWEWTSSKPSVYPGNLGTLAPEGQDWIVIRGGGYLTDPARSVSPISSCMREFISPGTKTTPLGFRLVRSG
jgi:formylglycine-generating enzyme required for sulfatase activity